MTRKTIRSILLLAVLILFFSQSPLAQENLPEIFKQVSPSVVVIITFDSNGKPLSQGSGFFINDKGDVITNGHVIEGAYSAQVKMADGKIYAVQKIMAEDRDADLVRLSTDRPVGKVRPLILNNTIPETGQRIMVIGSPKGFEQTLSDGIVSAVRDIPTVGKVLQISAPISLGSSGSISHTPTLARSR
jgi:S1-C subfamily serine protease